MGAENHSEVKIVFHKGEITTRPVDSMSPGDYYQVAECTQADRFASRCGKHLPGTWGLLKHDPEASGSTTLAGSNYVLSALVIHAIEYFLAWIETFDDVRRRLEMDTLLEEAMIVYGRREGIEALKALPDKVPESEMDDVRRIVSLALHRV